MGKSIIVTGGNRGIGWGMVKRLSEAGHKVIMTSRDVEAGEKACEGINGDVLVLGLDLSDSNAIDQFTETVSSLLQHVDVLINNAGIMSHRSHSTEADLADVRKVMEPNFFGALQLSQGIIPMLEKSVDGRIINVSSGMGALADLTGGYAGYRLSKTSLNGLTILMAHELQGKIKVNAMCPGWVKTDMGGAGAPRSVEQGADTAFWLATTENIPTGKFFRDRQEINW